MRRAAPLRTHTPLRPGKSLPRVAGKPRTRKPLREHRVRHVASNTPAVREDLTPGQRGLLWLRCDGRCEAQFVADCWKRVRATDRWEACHRWARGRGGPNTTLSNRFLACPPCHRWQHNHPNAAAETGHCLPTDSDPTRMVLRLPWHDVVLLDETRTYRAVM